MIYVSIKSLTTIQSPYYQSNNYGQSNATSEIPACMHVIDHKAYRPAEATVKYDILDGAILPDLRYIIL